LWFVALLLLVLLYDEIGSKVKKNRKSDTEEETVKIEQNRKESDLDIKVIGRLDTTTAPELEAVVKDGLNGISCLSFDFQDLEYISSAGLRVLLAAQKSMNLQNGKMVIRHVNDTVEEVFEVTGFTDILTIEK